MPFDHLGHPAHGRHVQPPADNDVKAPGADFNMGAADLDIAGEEAVHGVEVAARDRGASIRSRKKQYN